MTRLIVKYLRAVARTTVGRIVLFVLALHMFFALVAITSIATLP